GGFGVGAAISKNSVHNTVEARIVDADAASLQVVSGTTVTVKATDSAAILANAEGFAGSVGIAAASIGFVEASNTITSSTTARISNSKVLATSGAVEVLASSTGSIKSTPVAAAIAGGVVTAAGGGVLAKNSITPQTTAKIESNSSVTGSAYVKVEAKDLSSIDATIVAVSAGGGLGAVAIGLASAVNTIGGSIIASTASSTVTASSGNIEVLATANETVATFSVVLSASYGAIAAAGAAASTSETIQPNVTASVAGGSLTASGNQVNIHATFTGNSDPKTTAVSGSVGFGGAFSGVESHATIGGTTSASASGGTITANVLDIDATDNSTATSFALTTGLSTGISIAAVDATSIINRTTQAFLGAGTLNTNGGPVNVHATSTSTSTLDGNSIAAGLGAVSGVLLDSKAATTTQAFIDDGAQVTSGVVDVNAHANNTVTSTSLNMTISLAGGTVTTIKATDDSNVNSWIGPVAPNPSGGTAAAVTASGNVTVGSLLESNVDADAISVGIALLGDIGLIKAEASNTADVRSYLGSSAAVTATGHTVSFTSTLHASVDTSAFGVGAALGLAGSAVRSTADMTPTVSTFTQSGGSISAQSVSFTSNVNENLTNGTNCADFAACAEATAGDVAAGASGSDVEAYATDLPTIRTYIGTGTQVTATGSVNVIANGKPKAKSDGFGIAISGGFSGGVIKSRAVTAGSTATYIDGTVLQADSVTVRSNVDFTVLAHGENVAGAILGAGSAGSSTARIGEIPPSDPPTVATYVGGNGDIDATNDINVWSVVTTSARAETQAISGGVAAGRKSDSSTTVQPTIRTYAVNGAVVDSQSGDVSFLSAHNFNTNTLAPLAGKKAVATAGSYGGGVISLNIGSNIDALALADVSTSINSGATLRAGDQVSVKALSSNIADARFEAAQGGAISIGAGADPTATASGKTVANLLGNVQGVVPATVGAQSIDLLAKARDFAVAKMSNAQGGAVSVSDSHATSQGTPSVSITLGSSGNVIVANGNIDAQAIGLADSDAATTSGTGGAINVNLFEATATMNPTVMATVGGGASITSLSGTITVDATANQPPAPVSDGTFNAGTQVNGTSNTISFSLVHNAATGDIVTYDRKGQLQLPGLTNGLSYSLIVTGPQSVQLGATVLSSDVNTTLDIIDFGNRVHNLHTGDVVFYSVTSTPATTIGGLANGGQYKVLKIDDYKIKLQTIGFSSESATVSNPNTQINNGTEYINVTNTFENGAFVTYHAPAALVTFTSNQVNKRWNGSAWVAATNRVFFAVDANEDDNFDDIPLSNGERIFYTASNPSLPIGGLTNNQYYYVRRLNGQEFQFANASPYANPYCFAVGHSGDSNCLAPNGTYDDGSDGNPDPIPVTLITLNPASSDPFVIHSIRKANNAPIQGLTDGHNYYVVGCAAGPSGCSGTGFQLSHTSGGSAINIDSQGNTGGGHVFKTEGIDLKSQGAVGGFHKLVIDIAPASGTQQLKGIGGVGFTANDGDGIVSGAATGGGGGAVNVSNAQSYAKLDVTVSTTVQSNAV
ncbi:MAG: hypothetical protein GTO41_09230, partial [Burkholderiales bacterium]|nr:hypothetical protein [Burkholderiales bacterium]